MINYAAFCTLPERRQDVQTRKRRPAPLTKARTVCKFTFQRRFVTLWAWLIRLPNCGPFPHTSHILAIRESPSEPESRLYHLNFIPATKRLFPNVWQPVCYPLA